MGCSYNQVFVRCPFYLFDDDRKTITCEGVSDESKLRWIFQRKADLQKQMETFCCKDYEKCEVYRMLMREKYEDE